MSLYGQFKKYRRLIEDRIHQFDPRPVLTPAEFSWVPLVEAHHPGIKSEALAVLKKLGHIPNFDEVLPGQRALYQGSKWKSFYLFAMGEPMVPHQEMCPITTAALREIPNLMGAFFSILQPDTHIPAHRGPYGGILRYHLGVIVPEGDVGIRVDQQVCRWTEGKSLLFDDSFDHEAWNKTKSVRVVLFVDAARPLPGALGWLNKAVLRLMGLSREVRAAKRIVRSTQIGVDQQEAPSLL